MFDPRSFTARRSSTFVLLLFLQLCVFAPSTALQSLASASSSPAAALFSTAPTPSSSTSTPLSAFASAASSAASSAATPPPPSPMPIPSHAWAWAGAAVSYPPTPSAGSVSGVVLIAVRRAPYTSLHWQSRPPTLPCTPSTNLQGSWAFSSCTCHVQNNEDENELDAQPLPAPGLRGAPGPAAAYTLFCTTTMLDAPSAFGKAAADAGALQQLVLTWWADFNNSSSGPDMFVMDRPGQFACRPACDVIGVAQWGGP